MGGCIQGGSSETMGAEELNEPLAAADVEQGRARAVSDITVPGQIDPHKVRNAIFWTVLGFIFSNGVGLTFSFVHPRKHDAMMEFYAGYILELSLSLDNLFAFYLVFKYFKVVSEKAQNRVLFWVLLELSFSVPPWCWPVLQRSTSTALCSSCARLSSSILRTRCSSW